MSEHTELSRLPSDELYWERLEARILEAMKETAPFSSREVREWWAPLAERAYALGVLTLAAGIAAILLLPAAVDSPVLATGLLRPPSGDPALMSPLAAESPPLIGLLAFPDKKE